MSEAERLELREIGEGIWRAHRPLRLHAVPRRVSGLMGHIKAAGLDINPQSATYFFSREMVMTRRQQRHVGMGEKLL